MSKAQRPSVALALLLAVLQVAQLSAADSVPPPIDNTRDGVCNPADRTDPDISRTTQGACKAAACGYDIEYHDRVGDVDIYGIYRCEAVCCILWTNNYNSDGPECDQYCARLEPVDDGSSSSPASPSSSSNDATSAIVSQSAALALVALPLFMLLR
eukprot:jgi/Ulvmu1/11275/UM073_0047.1